MPFPAGAGMNRVNPWIRLIAWTVPRRRGDEPTIDTAMKELMRRSPQARG